MNTEKTACEVMAEELCRLYDVEMNKAAKAISDAVFARFTDMELVIVKKSELEKLQSSQKMYIEALECVDKVFQVCDDVPNPILPDFLGIGDNKFKGIVKLAEAYRDLKKEVKTLCSLPNVENRCGPWNDINETIRNLKKITENKSVDGPIDKPYTKNNWGYCVHNGPGYK